ncbi:hypothetical protein [Ramlibacter sp. Leaf400]|uniref:hypothetical protein n=1 Tax=Ramlibacter sp. Leaf400 TaxID=1736365 RepID=UPI0006F36651|nr:hypothetical protein [Ramlibacter sp. Leaf400]KQT14098.1 hypothetical protein ASG30_00485 [Ramlibacter sp. Leaf400]
MFIELPHTLSSATDLLLDPVEDFDGPQTVTVERPPRGSRGAEAASRIRVATGPGTRHWPAHASVDAGTSFELTFTLGDS